MGTKTHGEGRKAGLSGRAGCDTNFDLIASPRMPSPRTLLVLGRASNLPTVWSNCLAGWWLGGDHHTGNLAPLLLGGTFLYLGGMYLNDAFDVDFDMQFRRERPIPSGAIGLKLVWRIGLGLLGAGALCWIQLGRVTGALGLALVLAIVAYDALHKLLTISPVLMALCRFLLYLAAASTGWEGVTGEAVWCGLALGAYIVGLSYIARRESARGPLQWWPCLFLAAPVMLALLLDNGVYLQSGLLISSVFALWVIRCLRYTFSGMDRNIGFTVSGLLAGIVWVDLLAAADCPRNMAAVFIGLFVAAFLFQRVVPAT
jgi:4-hydroxybenzoate polyprenyltransferase